MLHTNIIKPVYGGTVQYAPVESTDPILPAKKTQLVQSKIDMCLYYGCGVDPTILLALNKLGTGQAKPTATIEKSLMILLDY